MTSKRSLFIAVAALAGSCWLAGASAAETPPSSPNLGEFQIIPDSHLDPQRLAFLNQCPPGYGSAFDVRFGWWGTITNGSPVKIGEYQDLSPSPFWDIDGLTSDGHRTLDMSLTGTDEEANRADVYYYQPGLTAKVDYDRYLRRRDNAPLVPDVDPTGGIDVVTDQLNVGQDFAIRVQELDTSVKGTINDYLRWRVNVWGMRKTGERQVRSVAHCYNNTICHVQGQGQHIDWLTQEIEPVLEANLGPVTAEYSRTMRQFTQDDQLSQAVFNHFGVFQTTPGLYDVGLVPENTTQIDRLKLRADLTDTTYAYGLLYNGDTHNEDRETDRRFYGYDLRMVSRPTEALTLSGYAKKLKEDNQNIPFALGSAPPFGEPIVNPANIGVTLDDMIGGIRFSDIRHPVDYDRDKLGFDSRWAPFREGFWKKFAMTGGYAFESIERSNVTYVIGDTDNPTRPDLATLLASGDARLFTQPDTDSHIFYIGPEMRWSPCFDTRIRYTLRESDNPLYGLRLSNEIYPETGDPRTMTNTNQPEHEDLTQFEATWTPADYFLLTGWVGIDNRSTSSRKARFSETTYPIVVSAWYAVTQRWSFNGGMGFYSNMIDQDITLGFRSTGFPAVTDNWSYNGRAQVYSFGSDYCATERLTLRGGVEYVRATDTFEVPTPGFTTIPQFSNVVVNTTRVTAGYDYRITPRTDTFFRYVLFDYDDETKAFNTGTSHMFLGGLSAAF